MKKKRVKKLDITRYQDTTLRMDKQPEYNCYCVLCGYDMINPQYWVNLTWDGLLVNTIDPKYKPRTALGKDDPSYPDRQIGFWPVGRQCRKRLPKGFVFRDSEIPDSYIAGSAFY